MTLNERTCIGCRKTDDRSTLVRYVARDRRVVADPAGTLPGRGAWLHDDQACMDRALKTKAFNRALRGALDAPGGA